MQTAGSKKPAVFNKESCLVFVKENVKASSNYLKYSAIAKIRFLDARTHSAVRGMIIKKRI
jgi:hypothetical protein